MPPYCKKHKRHMVYDQWRGCYCPECNEGKPIAKHLNLNLSVITYNPNELRERIIELCKKYKVAGTSVQYTADGK